MALVEWILDIALVLAAAEEAIVVVAALVAAAVLAAAVLAAAVVAVLPPLLNTLISHTEPRNIQSHYRIKFIDVAISTKIIKI